MRLMVSPTLIFLLAWLLEKLEWKRCGFTPPPFTPCSIWAECQGKMYWSVQTLWRISTVMFKKEHWFWSQRIWCGAQVSPPTTCWNLGKSLCPFELPFPLLCPLDGCWQGLITTYFVCYFRIYYLLSAGYNLGIVLKSFTNANIFNHLSNSVR